MAWRPGLVWSFTRGSLSLRMPSASMAASSLAWQARRSKALRSEEGTEEVECEWIWREGNIMEAMIPAFCILRIWWQAAPIQKTAQPRCSKPHNPMPRAGRPMGSGSWDGPASWCGCHSIGCHSLGCTPPSPSGWLKRRTRGAQGLDASRLPYG